MRFVFDGYFIGIMNAMWYMKTEYSCSSLIFKKKTVKSLCILVRCFEVQPHLVDLLEICQNTEKRSVRLNIFEIFVIINITFRYVEKSIKGFSISVYLIEIYNHLVIFFL